MFSEKDGKTLNSTNFAAKKRKEEGNN